MAIRFRIRSILILTAIAAVGMSIVAKPVVDQRAEQRILAKLFPPLPANQSPITITSAQSIPPQLLNSPLRYFHKDETLERVTFLATPRVDDEILRDIARFRYLTHLNLSYSNLSNEQALRLAEQLPNLQILDCFSTKVDYATLLKIERKHPQTCHLAHRHAVANLQNLGCYISPDFSLAPPGGGTPRHVHVRLKNVDSNVIDAVKHVGRPISRLSISRGHQINTESLKQLCDARSDFKISLAFLRASNGGPKPFSKRRFQIIAHPRVKWVNLANIKLEDDCRVPDENSYEFVQLRSCATNVVKAFADANVESLRFISMDVPIDGGNPIPASVKTLGLAESDISTVDLSHCNELSDIHLARSEIDLESSATRSVLNSLLTAPNLKKASLTGRFEGSIGTSLSEVFEKRGITLNINGVNARP